MWTWLFPFFGFLVESEYSCRVPGGFGRPRRGFPAVPSPPGLFRTRGKARPPAATPWKTSPSEGKPARTRPVFFRGRKCRPAPRRTDGPVTPRGGLVPEVRKGTTPPDQSGVYGTNV